MIVAYKLFGTFLYLKVCSRYCCAQSSRTRGWPRSLNMGRPERNHFQIKN